MKLLAATVPPIQPGEPWAYAFALPQGQWDRAQFARGEALARFAAAPDAAPLFEIGSVGGGVTLAEPRTLTLSLTGEQTALLREMRLVSIILAGRAGGVLRTLSLRISWPVQFTR